MNTFDNNTLIEEQEDLEYGNNPSTTVGGLSFRQALDKAHEERRGRLQREAELANNETAMYRALRDLGVSDGVNDYLAPVLQGFGNFGIGFWDSFARKWINVPALASRGLGWISEAALGGQSMFTDAANWLNDVDAAYVKASEEARRGITGANPTYWDDIFHGAGTSVGHAIEGLVGGGLALAGGKALSAANMMNLIANSKLMSESVTEAGNTASEVYAQDKSRGNDALGAGLYSLAANAPLDLVSGWLGTKFSNLAGNMIYPNADDGMRWYARNFLTNLVREETEELTQEPRQQAIEAAVKNMFKSGDMSIGNFLNNLGTEGKNIFVSHTDKGGNEIPSYFAQVAPSTAGSTLLTSIILSPLGLSGLTPRQARKLQYEQANQTFNDLKAQRDDLQARINDASNFYSNDAEQDLRTAVQLDELNTQLQDLDKEINNFWGGTNVITNPVQDDAGFDLFADIHTNIPNDDDDNNGGTDNSELQIEQPATSLEKDMAQSDNQQTNEPEVDTTVNDDTPTSTPVGDNGHVGTLRYTDSNGNKHTLTVKSGEFGNNHQNEKQYFGRYLEFTDDNGNVVARYSPYTRILQMADNVQDADNIRQAITKEAKERGNQHLRDFGYIDETGRLADDGNNDFREKHIARLDTNLPNSTIHPNNQRQSTQQRIDTRTKAQRKADAREQKAARKRVEDKFFKTLDNAYGEIVDVENAKLNNDYDKLVKEHAEKFAGKRIRGKIVNANDQLVQRVKEWALGKKQKNIRASFRQAAKAASIGYQALAHAYGMTVEEFVKSRPFDAISYLQAATDERTAGKKNNGNATIHIVPAYFSENDNKFHPEQLVMVLNKSVNPSSVLHEFGHGFLTELREVATTANDLPQDFRQDWLNLTKWLGVSDIDFTTPYDSWTDDQKQRWQNGQEKWAVGLEKYFAEGKSPSLWLKGMFNKFKTWMAHVYGNAKNMQYYGTDKEFHPITITPEVRKFYDNLFKDVPFVPNEENRQARLAKLDEQGNQNGSGETFNQPLNNDVDLDTSVNVVKITNTMPNVPFYQRIKAFGKDRQAEIINRFKNGAVVNEHTGLTITLSKSGLNHILDTARNNDNVGGAVLYQAIPYIDSLAKNAYRVETHKDVKPSATKIEGQLGNLKQVHRFLVPVELNDDTHILKLTAKEYDKGTAEIDEVSLYDMKYTKKMSAHPSTDSPNLMGRATQTIGSTNAISVRDMLEGVNDVEGNPYYYSEHTAKEKAKSEGVNVQDGTQPEAGLPNALSTESVQSNIKSVNRSNTHTPRIRRSNDTFVTQEDIERYDQLAYQGTGHIIEDNKFNLQYIGSGEGNQAFGWGLYFAENPKTSESYRRYGIPVEKNGGLTIYTNDGKSFSQLKDELDNWTGEPDRYLEMVLGDIAQRSDENPSATPDKILKSLSKYYEDVRGAFGAGNHIDSKIDALKTISSFSRNPNSNGNLYFVDVPENNMLLDWDSTTQPEKVQKGIQKVIAKLEKNGINPEAIKKLKNATTGEDFYRTLEKALRPLAERGKINSRNHGGIVKRADMAASLFLNQAGIPGLRYWDRASRQAGKGTHNFVIWNTDMTKLLGLSEDSDEDAKQYFKEQKAEELKTKKSESYKPDYR